MGASVSPSATVAKLEGDVGPDDVSIAVALDSTTAGDAAEVDENEAVEVLVVVVVVADAPIVLKMACARRMRVPDTKFNNT
jgi:hypothetical protein